METFMEDDPTNYMLVPSDKTTAEKSPSPPPSPQSSPPPSPQQPSSSSQQQSPSPDDDEVVPKKRVKFASDDEEEVIEDAKQVVETCLEEEEEEDDEERPPKSATNKKGKAFFIDDICERLGSAQDALFNNDYETVKAHIDYLARKCEGRTTLRKRDSHKRNTNTIYLHVYFNKRSVTVYNNSFQRPKRINGMVDYKSIKCGNTHKKEGFAIVKALKLAIAKYTYKCNLIPKNYLSVYDNKLEKCAKLVDQFIEDHNYKVVNENRTWLRDVNSMQDRKLYTDSSDENNNDV
uniref:ORF022 n=1 Tax=Spodoptera frugiperda granulovirus TaxID=307454 RepID=A0A346QVU1_9BBAC|nr:ORF022 [Spodoptera frugiperda granulovirus]